MLENNQKNDKCEAIGFENTYWYQANTQIFNVENDLINAPKLGENYRLLIHLVSGVEPTELELAQLRLISPNILLSKDKNHNGNSSKLLTINNSFYAIWLPPLLKENFWYDLDDSEPWYDNSDNEVTPQHALVSNIKLLKLVPSSIKYTSSQAFSHAYVVDVKVSEVLSLNQLTKVSSKHKVTPTSFGDVDVTTTTFEGLSISHWCEQGYLQWNMTTSIEGRNSLIMESTLGNEIITINANYQNEPTA